MSFSQFTEQNIDIKPLIRNHSFENSTEDDNSTSVTPGERRRSRRKESLEEGKIEACAAKSKTGQDSGFVAKVSNVSQEKTMRKSRKDSKHLRSKSTSELNRLKKMTTASNDRKVKATKVKEDKSLKKPPISGKETKRNSKAKKRDVDDLSKSDPLQTKLRELLDLVKGDAEEQLFIDHKAPNIKSIELSAGEPGTQNVRLKERPQSAKLERKPPEPKIKRPQSARTENYTSISGNLRHRSRSSDSLDEITIDATNGGKKKRPRPPSGKTQRGKSSPQEAFISDILYRELNETDSLVWDIDTSDCMTGASNKKKRPVSGE